MSQSNSLSPAVTEPVIKASPLFPFTLSYYLNAQFRSNGLQSYVERAGEYVEARFNSVPDEKLLPDFIRDFRQLGRCWRGARTRERNYDAKADENKQRLLDLMQADRGILIARGEYIDVPGFHHHCTSPTPLDLIKLFRNDQGSRVVPVQNHREFVCPNCKQTFPARDVHIDNFLLLAIVKLNREYIGEFHTMSIIKIMNGNSVKLVPVIPKVVVSLLSTNRERDEEAQPYVALDAPKVKS